MNELKTRWSKTASDLLSGCKILGVSYLTDKETASLGWSESAVGIELQKPNGSKFMIFPSCDDEGNNAGALFTTDKKVDTLPVV